MKALDILKLNKAMAGGWDLSNLSYVRSSISINSQLKDPQTLS